MSNRQRRPVLEDELHAPLEERLRGMRRRVQDASLFAFDEGGEDTDTVVAIMSGSTRKGQWEPAAQIRVFALMGGVDLDFRDADLLEGTTEIVILAVMGGCKVVVPPDVAVDVRGQGFMGGFSHVQHTPPGEDAPLIRIKGLAVMGGVEVKVK